MLQGVVMILKALAVVGWSALIGVSSASAQSLAGPAEMPPASFKGSQYVDSKGCVFLRAGIGDRITWVPRISRDRKPLCGLSPASAAREIAVTAPEPVKPAPAKKPPVAAPRSKPMETIASLPKRRAEQRPVPVRKTTPMVRLHNGCPVSSPYGVRVVLTDGRRSLICSPDQDLDVLAAARRVPGPSATADVIVPDGYRKAWKDGRLNPERAKGTAIGQAQQDLIWTRDVPATLVVDQDDKGASRTVLTRNAVTEPRIFVQVGTFGLTSNVQRTATHLHNLGLPVAKSRAAGDLQVVLAGPFGSHAAARNALGVVRRAGFGDAFIR